MGRLRLSAPRKKPGSRNKQQAFKRDAAVSQNADRANSLVMAHDALSAWWEEGAQAHLASKGFGPERQISAKGDTNSGSRYEGKLVGDSPELMPLDDRLFCYYEHSIKMHAALTRELPIGHPNRFGLGTPAEVSSTMRRVWEVAPTSEQIVHDISYYPKALDAIIAAEGAKVEDIDIRAGDAQA